MEKRLGPSRRSPFNWLQWLDYEVEGFSNTSNWTHHPPFQLARCQLFMMARYPQFERPFADGVLFREFSRGKKQLSEHPEARLSLSGLNDRQKTEAAALVIDIIEALSSYKAYRRRANRVHELAREAPSRIRMLNRKLKRAREAIEELREYSREVEGSLGWEYAGAAEDALVRLHRLNEDNHPEYYRTVVDEYPELEAPVTLGMIQLYWFFRYGCELTGDDAEVRVGRIRNAFWTSHGVSEVEIRTSYQTGLSKGCDAVHVAVSRFKQGTSLRKSR
jgi:hypothetical protein